MVSLFFLLGFHHKLKKLNEIIKVKLETAIHSHPSFLRVLDVLLGLTCAGCWCLVLCYKINLRSLINLLQPCHIITLFQAISLLYNSSFTVLLSLLSLPMIVGSGGAFLFPDTSGLDQMFEVEAFWVQHYLLQSIPLYLLLRHNAITAKIIDFKTILILCRKKLEFSEKSSLKKMCIKISN